MAHDAAAMRAKLEEQFSGIFTKLDEILDESKTREGMQFSLSKDAPVMATHFRELVKEAGYEDAMAHPNAQHEDTKEIFDFVRPLYDLTDQSFDRTRSINANDTARYQTLKDNISSTLDKIANNPDNQGAIESGDIDRASVLINAVDEIYIAEDEAAAEAEVAAVAEETGVDVTALSAAHAALVTRITDGDKTAEGHNDGKAVEDYIAVLKSQKDESLQALAADLTTKYEGITDKASFFVKSGPSKQIAEAITAFGEIKPEEADKAKMLAQIVGNSLLGESNRAQDIANQRDDSFDKNPAIEAALAAARDGNEIDYTALQASVSAPTTTVAEPTAPALAGTPADPAAQRTA